MAPPNNSVVILVLDIALDIYHSIYVTEWKSTRHRWPAAVLPSRTLGKLIDAADQMFLVSSRLVCIASCPSFGRLN